ncbi:MAG: cell wall hydrolase [Bacteroides sp.]
MIKKRFILLSVVLCILLGSVSFAKTPDGIEVTGYDGTVDYMSLMLDAARERNTHSLKMGAIYEQQRNLKLQDMGKNDMQTSIFCSTDVNEIIVSLTEYCAPEAQTAPELAVAKYTEEELTLLSKIIQAEAGSSWLSLEWKMCVGNVVINRVSSPKFPDTIKKVLEQPGQYYGKNSKYFNNIVPSEKSVEAAKRLLEGERLLPESVVFQANFVQGSGVHTALYDSKLGWTYFCYSSHMGNYK